MKKTIVFLFGIVLLYLLNPITAHAAAVKASGNLKCVSGSVSWNISENGILTYQGTGVLDAYETLTSFDLSAYHLDKSDIKEISTAGAHIILGSSCSNFFAGYSGLLEADLSGVDTSNVTSFHSAFQDCSSIETLDLSGFQTGKVTDMYAMFEGCSSLKSVDISSFDTGNVINMYAMFHGCGSLDNIEVNGFQTEKVTNMAKMFEGCSFVKTLDLSAFQTGNLINVRGMFDGCESLKSVDLSNMDVSGVSDFGYMFHNCKNLKKLDLKNFKTLQAKNIEYMFCGCTALKELDLTGFYTEKVETDDFILKDVELDEIHTPRYAFLLPDVKTAELWADSDNGYYEGGSVIKKETTVVRCSDTYSIRYMCDDGILYYTSDTYKVRDGLSELGTATRPYHVFEGWYLDADLTIPVNSVPAGTHTDLVFYAKWQHPWDNGRVIQEPTTTHAGEKIYTCTSCGEIRREVIPVAPPVSVAAVPQQTELPVVAVPKEIPREAQQITVGRAKISSITAANQQLTVNIGKVADASGYQVQISASKKFKSKKTITVLVKGNSKKSRSVVLKKEKKKKNVRLRNGFRYYVRIRAVKTVKSGGNTIQMFGRWSPVRSKKPHKYKKKVTKTIYY